MKKEKILEHLLQIARELGITVRQEKGDFAGGYCIKEQENLVLLNKRHMIDRRICVLAREIATFDLSNLKIPPAVMNIIESEKRRATTVEADLSDSEGND